MLLLKSRRRSLCQKPSARSYQTHTSRKLGEEEVGGSLQNAGNLFRSGSFFCLLTQQWGAIRSVLNVSSGEATDATQHANAHTEHEIIIGKDLVSQESVAQSTF